jgi:hypothetical protein
MCLIAQTVASFTAKLFPRLEVYSDTSTWLVVVKSK